MRFPCKVLKWGSQVPLSSRVRRSGSKVWLQRFKQGFIFQVKQIHAKCKDLKQGCQVRFPRTGLMGLKFRVSVSCPERQHGLEKVTIAESIARRTARRTTCSVFSRWILLWRLESVGHPTCQDWGTCSRRCVLSCRWWVCLQAPKKWVWSGRLWLPACCSGCWSTRKTLRHLESTYSSFSAGGRQIWSCLQEYGGGLDDGRCSRDRHSQLLGY